MLKIKSYLPHIVLAFFMILLLTVCIVRLSRWNKNADTADDFISTDPINPADYVESEDYYTYPSQEYLSTALNDGVLNILLIGDGQFGSFSSGPDIASMLDKHLESAGIPALSTSVSVPEIYFCAPLSYLDPDAPENDFCVYGLVRALCRGSINDLRASLNESTFVLDNINANRQAYKSALACLSEIQMENIDIIVLSTGIWDFINPIGLLDLTDIYRTDTHSGSIAAAMRLLRESYPGIRTIALSPLNFYVRDADGELNCADTVNLNGLGRFGDYVVSDKYAAVSADFTYLDNLFGAGVGQGQIKDYLEDDLLMPNPAGREILARRVAEVLQRDFS